MEQPDRVFCVLVVPLVALQPTGLENLAMEMLNSAVKPTAAQVPWSVDHTCRIGGASVQIMSA